MIDDANDESFLLSRRVMMGGIGLAGATLAGAALAAAPALGAGMAREAGIPADTAARVALLRRVRLRTDAGMVYWWFRGRNYAQQGAVMTPLCELVFGAVMKVTPGADGSMDVSQFELGFRLPLDSAEWTDKLRNPLTGEMVDAPYAPVGPTHIHYNAHNDMELPAVIGGAKFSVQHIPELFYHIGDQVCFQTHSAAVSETPGGGTRRLNDMSMITSPASEALNPKVRCASAFAHGTDIGDYARWWKMPPGLGVQTLRSVGRKETTYAAMPQDWVAMLARVNPEAARNPLKLLEGPSIQYRN